MSEIQIAYLKTQDGLEFKLTNQKLFISNLAGSETFALRSINGIGVIDLIDEYDEQLRIHNARKANRKVYGAFAVALGLAFSFYFSKYRWGGWIIIMLGLYSFMFKTEKPEMLSSVRIMLNGMNRDFVFNKRLSNSLDVANFVARVEDTLTAFHKD